jgi:hypothetical protein
MYKEFKVFILNNIDYLRNRKKAVRENDETEMCDVDWIDYKLSAFMEMLVEIVKLEVEKDE